jgi:hypothetical protein
MLIETVAPADATPPLSQLTIGRPIAEELR